jgi:hypothetical protein
LPRISPMFPNRSSPIRSPEAERDRAQCWGTPDVACDRLLR